MVPLCLGVHHGPFPTAFCGPSCWRTATESRGIKSREAAGWLLGSYQLLQSPNLRSSNLETRCKPKHTSQQSPGEGSLRRSHVACLQLNTADLARRWLCTTGAMSSRIRAALWGHWRVQGLGQQGRVLGSGFMALGFWHTRIAWMYAGCVGSWVQAGVLMSSAWQVSSSFFKPQHLPCGSLLSTQAPRRHNNNNNIA